MPNNGHTSPLIRLSQLRNALAATDDPDTVTAILGEIRQLYEDHGDLAAQIDAMRLESARRH